MTQMILRRHFGVSALVVMLLVGSVSPVSAAEPIERFLDRLREREMHDAALMYIDSLRSRQDVSAEIKQTLPYEEGRTLVEQSLTFSDAKRQLDTLDAAAAKFQAFLKDNPNHDRVPATGRQLGRILRIRADRLIDQARRPVNAAQSEQMLEDGRKYYREAQAAYEAAEKTLDKLVKESRPWLQEGTSAQQERARTARSDYLQIRLDIPEVVYLLALSYPEDSKERLELLSDSAKKFDEFAKQFRRYHAASFALMYQGRSLMGMADAEKDEKKAEQHRKQAAALFTQLTVEVESDPDARSLQFQVIRLAMANHMDAKKPELDQAIKLGEKWANVFRGREESSVDALGIKFLLARALAKQREATEAANQKRNLARQAVELARFVARYPSPFRDEARQIVADLGGGVDSGEPQTFEEAFELAKQHLETSRVHSNEIAQASDDEERAEARKKQKEAEKAAFDAFTLALNMRNIGEPPATEDQINQIRYFQTYLYFQEAALWEAALLGEFLARRSPGHTSARPASAIALAAYTRLYNSPQAAQNRSFEARRMSDLADFIINEWPEDNVARQATLAMIDISRAAGDREKVLALLANVPNDSPSRADVELKVGDFLWKEYLRESRRSGENEAGLSTEDLSAMSQKAKELLEAGVATVSSRSGDEPTSALLAAKLSLAQLYTRSGQMQEALALINAQDPPGLLTLVEVNHPAIQRLPGLRPEVFRLALQAFVANNDQDKAIDVMDKLENEFKGQGADAQTRLTRIYIRLGLELQEDLKRYKQEGKTDQYNQTLDAAKAFLTRIGQREEGVTFTVLSWISETFYNLAEAADGPASREFYDEARKTYQRMLSNKEPGFWPAGNEAAYKLRTLTQVARCLRGVGRYEDSLKIMKDILEKNKSNLDVQREATQTYQDWGIREKDTDKLTLAMMGDPPRSKDKVVWGWDYTRRALQTFVGRLRNEALDAERAGDSALAATKLQQAEAFSSRFHEAQYNLSYTMFHYAQNQTAAERQSRYLDQAERSITALVPLYPEMGGEEWYGRYDRLLRDIQRLRGQAPTGLAPFVAAARERQQAASN